MTFLILSDSGFNMYFEKNKQLPIILFFMADWCDQCKNIKTFVEREATRNRHDLTVLRIDSAQCDEAVVKYGITSIPTFVLVINDVVKYSFNGANEEKFLAMIDKALE